MRVYDKGRDKIVRYLVGGRMNEGKIYDKGRDEIIGRQVCDGTYINVGSEGGHRLNSLSGRVHI